MKTDLEKRLDELQKEMDNVRAEINKPDEVKFEEGRWYTDGDGRDAITFCPNRIEEYKVHGYGFSSGVWLDEGYFVDINSKGYREATKEEVEAALIKEAEKRGFKHGNFKCLCDGKVWKKREHETVYKVFHENNSWWIMVRGGACFIESKWAEIIKDEPIIIKTTCGEYHEVEIASLSVKVDCFNIDRNVARATLREMLKTDWFKAQGRKQVEQILERL